jgi:peptidoglycan hydrolase-like protein with peptidoglycan-binding domain
VKLGQIRPSDRDEKQPDQGGLDREINRERDFATIHAAIVTHAYLKPKPLSSDTNRDMRTCRLRFAALPLVLAALTLAPAAAGSRDAGVAALQVALQSRGVYAGSIDGLTSPATTSGIKRFQRRVGLPADGVAGASTRRALGSYGKHLLGSRPLTRGAAGWDVAALQFLLAWHGFPSATIDGGLGENTDRALRRFQRWAGLKPDGIARDTTYAALRSAPATCPIALAWPLDAPTGDVFGPRHNRFHAGIDLVAPRGTAVGAAAAGRVVFAGFAAGGWGNLVIVVHADGVKTMYAHLATVTVHREELVAVGSRVGTVGATGHASGPHLHFEVRLRGAAVDPRRALP